MKLSVIIPVLNEATRLPETLAQLAGMPARGVEVIVVDGGSSDESVATARAAGVRTLSAQTGRARQMNLGAAAATGDALLFVHADTTLPPRADALVLEALGRGSHAWGRFDVMIEGRPWMLRVVAAMMNRRSRLTGIATGDQAMFVTRTAFEAVGGFPEQPLMEDIELSRRLLDLSRPECLRHKVCTSGRRWERHGVWRTIALMWRLRFAYWRGTPPDELARVYR